MLKRKEEYNPFSENACLIWCRRADYDLVNLFVQARHTFDIEEVPEKCLVKVTADSRYKLSVNGEYVCKGPVRGYQESWPFDRVDISPWLKPGKNLISAQLYSYGIGTYFYVHAGRAGFILDGKIGDVDISTSSKWRVRCSPAHTRHSIKLSVQMGFQEFYDAREDSAWEADCNYDDSSWVAPCTATPGSMPWHSFQERGILLLNESIIYPEGICSTAEGKNTENCDEVKNIIEIFHQETNSWKEDIRQVEENVIGNCPGLNLPPSGEGKHSVVVFDFGREVVGSPRIEIDGAKGGEIVDILATEAMDGNEPIFCTPEGHHLYIGIGGRVVLKKGITQHEIFEAWGFRYLVLIVRNSTAPLKVSASIRNSLYPMNVTASFQASDETLNEIWKISEHTQRCCTMDTYVDCPWREQAQWWGDARVQGANTFYLSADTRVFEFGIRSIADQRVPNGLTYGHAPTIGHSCVLPDFTLTWVLTIWDHYWQTGSTEMIQEMHEKILEALAYFHDMRMENGFLGHDSRYWLFLDWSDLYKGGKNCVSDVYNLFYLMTLQTSSKMLGLIGDKENQGIVEERAKELETAFTTHLLDKATNSIYGGLDENGKPVLPGSPQTASLAIIMDLFPEAEGVLLEKLLLPLVSGNREQSIIPSPFFMYYIFEALKKTGNDKEVVDCIRRWWSEALDLGYSTTPERWSPPPGRDSLCHAWSAHPIVHLSNIILGIRQETAGWTKIKFKPLLSELESSEGTVATPLGDIKSSWKVVDNQATVKLALPEGVSAEVELPSLDIESVTGTNVWTCQV